MKKISYRTRIMLVFTAIIAAFAVGVILFEQQQWKMNGPIALNEH